MTKRTNHKEVFQQEMLNSVLESLKQEIIPWEKPWDNYSGLPMNAVTNKAYNGGNSMNLLFSGLSKGLKDPRWCTFKQAKSQGWSIKKDLKITDQYKEIFVHSKELTVRG